MVTKLTEKLSFILTTLCVVVQFIGNKKNQRTVYI